VSRINKWPNMTKNTKAMGEQLIMTTSASTVGRRILAPYEFERMCRTIAQETNKSSFIYPMLVLAASTEAEKITSLSDLVRKLGLPADAVRPPALSTLIEHSYLICRKSEEPAEGARRWLIQIPENLHTVNQCSFDGKRMLGMLSNLISFYKNTNSQNRTSTLAALILVGLHIHRIEDLAELNSYIGDQAKSDFTCHRIVDRLAEAGLLGIKKVSDLRHSATYLSLTN
jgi:hypothetical protein